MATHESNPTTVRLPDTLRADANFVCAVEGITMTSLILAGLSIEVDRRRSDPEFAAKVAAFNSQAAAFFDSENS